MLRVITSICKHEESITVQWYSYKVFECINSYQNSVNNATVIC